MDKEARDAYLQSSIDKERERRDAHTLMLKHLEEAFGFDLDVATDIYGLELLDATEESRALVAVWHDLFTQMAANPGKPLFILTTRRELRPGCHGFGQPDEYDTHIDVSGISEAHLEAVEYVRASDENSKPTIAIAGDSHVYIGGTLDIVHRDLFMVAQRETDIKKLMRVRDETPVIDHPLEHCTVLYNPAPGDVQKVIHQLIAHDPLQTPFHLGRDIDALVCGQPKS